MYPRAAGPEREVGEMRGRQNMQTEQENSCLYCSPQRGNERQPLLRFSSAGALHGGFCAFVSSFIDGASSCPLAC